MRLNKRGKKITQAEQADKFALYEQAVQSAEFEIDWVTAHFQTLRDRPLRKLREDFCGTANAACEHVRRHKDNMAIGVDLDPYVLQWGESHRIAQLPPAARARVQLVEKNVIELTTPGMDAILAMNFSYWVFKTRHALAEYFAHAYANLAEDGIFFLDAFGGYECFNDDQEEKTDYKAFTYVWYLKKFNPVDHHVHYQINFEFKDKSKIAPAFEYHWRHWHLPELRELLTLAGFKKTTVWMQGWDEKTGTASDQFNAVEDADADPGWVAYITAEK